MKMCNRCGRELSEDNFSKDKSKKDGLRTICKDCTHKRQKQYREENKDKVAEAKKKYAQENKEKIARYKKKYSEENKEHIAEV